MSVTLERPLYYSRARSGGLGWSQLFSSPAWPVSPLCSADALEDLEGKLSHRARLALRILLNTVPAACRWIRVGV